jgi:hypothetical protein
VQQNTTLDGNLLIMNSSIVGNLIPQTGNLYDIGSVTNRWRDLYLENNLEILGNATFGNDFSIDILTINSKICGNLIPKVDDTYDLGSITEKWKDCWISGNVNISNQLIINGNLTIVNGGINGNLLPTIDNQFNIGSGLLRWKDAWIAGNLIIDSSVTFGTSSSDLININSSFNNDLIPSTGNSLNIGSGAAPWKDLFLGGALTVEGQTLLGNSPTDIVIVNSRFASDLIPSLDSTYNLGDSSIRWNNSWIDNIVITTLLTLDGSSSISGNIIPDANDTWDLGTTLTRWKSLYLSDELNVNGNTTLGSDINVDIINLNSKIDASGGLLPTVDSTYNIGSSLFKWNDIFLSGDATIDGNITIGINIANTLTINGGITTDLLPFLNNSVDLGNPINKWKDIYLAGDLNVDGNTILGDDVNNDELELNCQITSDILPKTTSTYDLGSTTNKWMNLWLSNNLNVDGNTILGNDVNTNTTEFQSKIDTDILPTTTATYDLGSSTFGWRDIYLETNVYVNGLIVLSQRQPSVGPLTDSSGGTDAGSIGTIQVITDSNNTGSADLIPTQDAIATLAGQIERILDILRNHGLIFV